MKSVKLIFSIILAGLTVFSSSLLSATEGEVKDSFEKSFGVSATGNFSFMVYDSDVDIAVWDKNEVRIAGEIIVSGGNKEDIARLISAFKNVEAKTSNGSLELNTEFYTSQVSVKNLYNSVVLKNGGKVSVDNFKATYKLWMPASMALTLKSKYNKVNIENLTGNANFSLYDVDLNMGNFGSQGNFDMKYCKVNMGNGGVSSFNLYDTDVEGAQLGNIKVNAKYSKVILKKAGDIKVTSYDDDFVFDQLVQIDAEAKYSSFKLGSDAGSSEFDLYDSDISAKGFKSLQFSAKYSDLNAGSIGSMNIPSSYDNNYNLGTIGTLQCNESKYDQFKIEGITGSAGFPNAYDTQIAINRTGASFKEFSGKFTYGKVYLKIDPSVQFNLSFTSTYGAVNIPSDKLKVKSNSDETNSKRVFEGSTSNDAKCDIKFTTYDTNFTIE
ncbi:MAG: hypothetical protein AB7S54_00790 [Bacteroidales bacterium]